MAYRKSASIRGFVSLADDLQRDAMEPATWGGAMAVFHAGLHAASPFPGPIALVRQRWFCRSRSHKRELAQMTRRV